MKSGWLSQTKRYVPPFWNVTVQVGLLVLVVSVLMSTPGPTRWKLCSAVSSTTRIV